MKITFILPGIARFPVGGFQVVYDYANYLVKKGYDIEILHAMFLPTQGKASVISLLKYRLKKALRKLGILKPWFILDKRIKVRDIGKVRNEDVRDADKVIATAWETAEFVAQLPDSCGTKYYFIQHYEIWGGKERVDATWHLPLHKIVIATWLKKIAENFGEKACLVPNFIQQDNFYMVKDFEARVPTISMLYSEHAVKGSEDGINALKMIREKNKKVRIKIFGVFDKPKNLPEYCEYIKNPSRKYLREKIYNESTIYLFPSVSEGWGLTATEAMACGAALCSTDNGGVDDFGINNETALISPVHSPQKLYLNLKKLLDDDQLRVKLAQNGQRSVKKLTLENSGHLFEKALGLL
ncbi:glycosyltransferase family 4 protein [Lactiplantibacillus daowaiensis]|uniref:Glycosyltransferase family 4 protein n=1 Tax=Lactiplantibacillus daowaiensis TaxID=2559918 RepID=A0ABW1RWN3_9LACO|nr:glycosyltransferase family 4 protein [Lactiplantibacillus daowaiensis]